MYMYVGSAPENVSSFNNMFLILLITTDALLQIYFATFNRFQFPKQIINPS